MGAHPRGGLAEAAAALPRALVVGAVLLAPPLGPRAAEFLRGDANSSGALDVGDAVTVLRSLFLPGPGPLECLDAGDADDSGAIDIADAVYVLEALFRGGAAPPSPYPDCGPDPTPDLLDCASFECFSTIRIGGMAAKAGCVVFVIDRSSSMKDGGELSIAKRQVTREVASLRPETEVGIVLFDTSVVKFPPAGGVAAATEETKLAATESLEAPSPGGASCVQQALSAALTMASTSSRKRALIVYLGDGGGTCQGADEATYLGRTLETVTAQNGGRVRVCAVGLLVMSPLQESFLRRLAEANGGWFVRKVR